MPDTEIELERIYTVPLSRAWIAPRHRRTVRAVNVLREFAERHMKSEEIKIDADLNEMLWSRGITKPPRRVTVKMTKDEDGLVTISLPKTEAEEEGEAVVEQAAPEVQQLAEKPPTAEPKPEEKIAEAKAVERPKPQPRKSETKSTPKKKKKSTSEKKKQPAKKKTSKKKD